MTGDSYFDFQTACRECGAKLVFVLGAVVCSNGCGSTAAPRSPFFTGNPGMLTVENLERMVRHDY